MRKSLRLTLAAATGAAVLATGAAITVASPAYASSSVSDVTFSEAFIPPSGSDKIGVSIKVSNPYAPANDAADTTHNAVSKGDPVTLKVEYKEQDASTWL